MLIHQPTSIPDLAIPLVVPPAAVETVGVLHVVNGEHYAGAERVQDLLAKRLPEFGFSVGFACVKLDMFDELRESRDAQLYDVPMWNRFDIRAARKIAGIIQRGGYRLLHSHTVRTAMIGRLAAAMAGVPMVYHAHSPASNDCTHRWKNRVNGFMERTSIRGASRVIAVSESLAEHVKREGFDPARVRVVPNGVPGLPELPRRPAPHGCWTIGTVALFRPRKGIEVLLEALANLHRQEIEVKLRAVGEFETQAYADHIHACARNLGLSEHVTWVGFARDVTSELLKMDIFVLPSLFGEGLPMVVLEAMGAGVPVVATRVAGSGEAIRHGRDGLLVAPGDACEVADAVASVVNGRYDWSALRSNAHRRQQGLFSDKSMAEGVAAVYGEVLAEEQERD